MVAGLRKSMCVVAGVVFSLVISLCGVALAATAPAVSVLEPITNGVSTPLKTALDLNGDMYVADPRSGGVVVLDQYGVVKQVMKTAKPVNGIALLGNNPFAGKVLVGQGGTLAVLDQSGAAVAELGAGALSRVTAVAVDSVGNIYAADAATHSVKKLTQSGGLVAEFGNANLGSPASIAVISDGGVEQVVVADARYAAVYFYTTTGSLIKVLGTPLTGLITNNTSNVGPLKFVFPSGVAFEYAAGVLSRVYVLDMFQGQIQAIDAATGQFLSYVSGYGSKLGALLTPSDIQFDAINKRLLVANGLSNIVSLGIDGGTNPVNGVQPQLAIGADNIVVSAPSVTLSGTVDVNCTLVAAADTGAKASAASFPSQSSWMISVDGLAVGRNIISVTAKNQYGNATTKTVTVTYQPPAAALSVDAYPLLTDQAALPLTGKVQAGSTVAIYNAATGSTANALVVDGAWVINLSLAEGPNAITVTASNAATSGARIDLQVVLDTVAPIIVPSMIADGSNSASQVLNVAGTVREPNLASLTVNGQSVVPVNGVFNAAVALSVGSNTVTINAADSLGHVSSLVRTITFNPDLPVVAVAAPVDGAYTNVKDVVVSGTVAQAASLKVNGVAVDVDAATGQWSAPVSLVAGLNTIAIEAADVYGQTVVAKRTVTYDNNKPVAAVVTPAQDVATNNPSLQVKGVYGDDQAVKSIGATVNGQSVPVVLQNGEFTVFQAMDVEGPYTVTVVVTDLAGNVSTAQRTVIYDVTPPAVVVDALDAAYPQLLTGTVENGATVVVKDAAGAQAVVTVAGKAWSADFGGVSYDPTTLQVVATDPAGNASLVRVNLPKPDGDVDGDGVVTIKDALVVLKLAVSGEQATARQLTHGDVGPLLNGKANPNGTLDIVDGILILRRALKLSSW